MALYSIPTLSAVVESTARTNATYSTKSATTLLNESTRAFSEGDTFDIFLSHSYLDAKAILGLKLDFQSMGFSVYVDWIEDRQLDRSKVSKETADLLRRRMKQCKCLFFATSPNSSSSLWMPWELGFFDGFRGKVAIVPVLAENRLTEDFTGTEYLGLYPYVVRDHNRATSKMTLWIRPNPNQNLWMVDWLKVTRESVHWKNG